MSADNSDDVSVPPSYNRMSMVSLASPINSFRSMFSASDMPRSRPISYDRVPLIQAIPETSHADTSLPISVATGFTQSRALSHSSTASFLPPPIQETKISGSPPSDWLTPLHVPSELTCMGASAAQPPPPKEFHYELKKKGKMVAILTLITDGSLSRNIPTFTEGRPVKGRVQLNLEKPDPIQSVTITILGQLITSEKKGDQKPVVLPFIDINHTLWSQAHGKPRNFSGIYGDSSPNVPYPPTKCNEKLVGDYIWPFSLHLPHLVDVPCGTKNEPQTFSPPQTFIERCTWASITYEICLDLGRDKLHADHRIHTQFGYIPIGCPPPMSSLRFLAYTERFPLLGPAIDPAGWHSMDAVSVKGKAFNDHAFDISCKLFLAKPLAYTRGSIIPLYLCLEGTDTQVLDLLSSPKAIVARLRRRLMYDYSPGETTDSVGWRDTVDYLQLAVWWPSTERSEFARYVNGEIHLRCDLKPTSALASFRIEYSVVLLPFEAVGVHCSNGRDELAEQRINIVTAYAPGIRPRSLAPAGYETDVGDQVQDRPLYHLTFF